MNGIDFKKQCIYIGRMTPAMKREGNVFDKQIIIDMLPNTKAIEVYAALNGVDFRHEFLYITYRKIDQEVAVYVLVRNPNSKNRGNIMFNHKTMKYYTAAGGLPYM